MRNLEPNTNIWYNADRKNPVWIGGRKEYGTKRAPRSPYHYIPSSYQDILTHIKKGLENNMFTDTPVAFITGHTEIYKKGDQNCIRLKTLGNLTNKMQIEAKLETVLSAQVDLLNGEREYILETQNSGINTVRSPMGVFEPKIPNDYKLVLEGILGQL